MQKQQTKTRLPRKRKSNNKNKSSPQQSNSAIVPSYKSNVVISHCASDYARCLANPFPDGPMACIPDFPTLMSSRQRVWSRGTLSTSATTGFGFVAVDVLASAVSDLSSVWASASTFTGTSVVPAVATGVTPTNTNSQYTEPNVTATAAGLQFRVVSSGLRVRYIGTELERGGYKIGFSDPTHSSVNGQSVATLNAEPSARRFPIDRKWATVLYRPILNDELNYQNSFDLRDPIMCFVFTAASPTTPLTYEYEFYSVIEYQGRSIKGMTPSHSDPVGFAAVSSSSLTNHSLHPTTLSGKERESSMLESVANYVKHGVSTATNVANTAKSVASNASNLIHSTKSAISEIGAFASLAEPLLVLL